jgi:heat shock protein HslJ
MGYWKHDSMENLIVLGTKRGSLKTMTLINNSTIRLLNVEGKEISSNINYDLHKADALDPFEDIVQLRGMYSIVDNSAIFVDCQNETRFKVVKEKDYTGLEYAYNNTPHGQGEFLLVIVEGSLQLRPSTGGSGHREVLVVEQFKEIKPLQDCVGNSRKTTLFETTWKVIELAGKPVTLTEGQREAYVILEMEGNKMHGFSGCNRFFGTYLVKGEIFVFNKMASTRMACMKGLDLESNFLNAMHNTEAYRIVNGILELRDRDEQVLARLQAEK